MINHENHKSECGPHSAASLPNFAGSLLTGSSDPGELVAGEPCEGRIKTVPNSYGGSGTPKSGHPDDCTGAATLVQSNDFSGIRAHGANRTNGKVTEEDARTAAYRRRVIEAFAALRAGGVSITKAARKVGEPYLTIWRWSKAYDAHGFDGLLPKHKNSGRPAKNKFSEAEAAQVKDLVLNTNRTRVSGSTPEALRAGLKRGIFSEETAALLRARFESGVMVLPPVMREQVRVSEATTEAYRAPRNAWLNRIQSPGSLMLTREPLHGGPPTGEEREIEPGEKWTIDDGTINFVCCVPFNLPGNPCADKFGVMVGRFQFIVPADHRSYFIPGFNYTARPRSSYRAEDLTATLHTIFLEHGYPRAMVLEHGVSAANLVSDTLGMLGIKIERASSPHQKIVEFLFNKLWTKLSLMPGQVGRFRGEEEEVTGLINSCRRGATDPRKYFPLLADVLKALHEVIAEHNSQLVQSRQYGKWVPAEFFSRKAPAHLRKLDPESAWIFAPTITDPLLIQGCKVRKSVCLMEGYTEVFDFSAEWMAQLNGVRVKMFFNPFAPDCLATVVLAQTFQGRKAGEVLGVAEQINRMTRFRRRALGYGTDPDIGLDATRRNAQALRRSVVAIRVDGAIGAQSHEARNGLGDASSVTVDGSTSLTTGGLTPLGGGEGGQNMPVPAMPAGSTATPLQRMAQRAIQRAAGVSEEEFDRQAQRLERASGRQTSELTVSDE